MKTKEFNLSEKIHAGSMLAKEHEYFFKEDVKEAVRLLKEAVWRLPSDNKRKELIEEIDKIFGDKLI